MGEDTEDKEEDLDGEDIEEEEEEPGDTSLHCSKT